MLGPNEVLIHDGNAHLFVVDQIVDGERKSRGGIPRNYDMHPHGFYKGIKAFTAVDMPLLAQADWDTIAADKIAQGARLSDIRLRGNSGSIIPSRDQNGRGYCWQHSGVSAELIIRAVMNAPYASLSAYGPACVIKNFADEGGWGAQGVDFLMARGCPTDEFWPQQSVNRANDNKATWENAAKYKITEGWIDLQVAQYDRKLSFAQVITCLLCGIPVVVDFNWWSHSVCAIDAVNGESEWGRMRVDSGKLMTLSTFCRVWGMDDPVTAGWGIRVWNSWGENWSDRGMGTLAGSKAVPDGSVAPRVAIAA